MSKAKEKYYNAVYECDDFFGGMISEITDYVKELEEQNKKMLGALIQIVDEDPLKFYNKSFKHIVIEIIEELMGIPINELFKF